MNEQRQEAYLQFLMEVLRATLESEGDAKVVYPLLEANTDKLDNIFAEILRRWATNKFEEAENVKNYKLYLEKIKQIWIEDDLKFLSSFLELAEDTFIEQINTDLAYLTAGQNLFEQLIESIGGIVEIEQTKRDRSLEKTIQIVGIGLGGGAIVSGVVAEHIDKPFLPINSECPTNSKCPIHPLVSSLLWSLLATICFSLLGWCLTVWREKRN